MNKKTKKKINNIIAYIFISAVGIAMIYPIIWMFFATFKDNAEIFGSTGLLPKSYDFSSFVRGWKSNGGNQTYTDFFINTFVMVIPTTLLTVASCSVVAYGFARFKFPFKKQLFMLLIATLMLPNAVIIIPRYSLYNTFGWIDTYLPFYVPALLATYPFFIFMLIQFTRGLPRELDESAYMDGCGTLRVFWNILLPLMKPALFSAGLFQFMWTYNDYLNSLIFINSTSKYTISLALRLSLDAESVVQWDKVMAMASVAVLPLIILFFLAQKYFVEGISTTGLKG
ncbi:carbohydrate ABC transporter permease [Konateibacter massiliensis]|uniref:carbohydrate ABC transporter permease n=1 Tax=Konateibacter massiliensis TaxID=2002841 RepID=UPI0015D51E9C|nr:carbohydrate ABC transporter permease [Konateibacter massiliensis]